jgi:8-hydroxy-5-deazaflavin:NADPH oxidoreductase
MRKIIGGGKIGSTAPRLFVAADPEVAIANRRGQASLAPLTEELKERLHASSVEDAPRFGEPLVLVAVPFGAYDPPPAGAYAAKIVSDTSNCYPGCDRHDAALNRDQTTPSELLTEHLPAARIVTELVEERGFAAIDPGDLAHEGHQQHPNRPIHAKNLTRVQTRRILR